MNKLRVSNGRVYMIGTAVTRMHAVQRSLAQHVHCPEKSAQNEEMEWTCPIHVGTAL